MLQRKCTRFFQRQCHYGSARMDVGLFRNRPSCKCWRCFKQADRICCEFGLFERSVVPDRGLTQYLTQYEFRRKLVGHQWAPFILCLIDREGMSWASMKGADNNGSLSLNASAASMENMQYMRKSAAAFTLGKSYLTSFMLVNAVDNYVCAANTNQTRYFWFGALLNCAWFYFSVILIILQRPLTRSGKSLYLVARKVTCSYFPRVFFLGMFLTVFTGHWGLFNSWAHLASVEEV